MKKIFLIAGILLLLGAIQPAQSILSAQPTQSAQPVNPAKFAQSTNPVSWSVSVEPKGNYEYLIKAVGTIEPADWHIYDLNEYKGGPNGTVVTVEGPSSIEVIEAPRIVSSVHRQFDETFGMEVGTCSAPVIIETVVRKVAGPSEAQVTIEWQACKEGMCVPPSEYTATVEIPVADGGSELSEPEEASNSSSSSSTSISSSSSSLWKLILEAMAWGFVALLTPCVFPMIPLIVSFFLKQNDKKRKGRHLAIFFGLSIIILYTVPIAILIAATLLTGGQQVTADIFNFLATHWIPNLLFFIIFMIFAASFFGAFDLELPSKLTNKFDSKSEMGGVLGAFFVALTLVLVSFSCTGPIVGSVLIKSTQGKIWEPVITMFAFSLAFALPFTLFAFAPSLLKKLPKSGGWLNSVKVILGFIELALGFKFLSVADQTYHWGILDREVYLAIWIVIFSLLGFYLLGKLKFKNDSPLEYISVTRLGLAIATFAFVVYMIPGMWGAPLKALSGYLPPITTQDFVLGKYCVQQELSPSPLSEARSDAVGVSARIKRNKYSDFLKLPYGIPAHFDYAEALEDAKLSGKPLFVDFTGHGCVNCREMEARVWSDPRVLKMLKEDFIVCALYADDKKVLPEEDWVTTDDGKILKSLGKINSYFALKRFNVNAQPYYTILDPDTEQPKTAPRGYNLDVEAFVKFLEAGL